MYMADDNEEGTRTDVFTLTRSQSFENPSTSVPCLVLISGCERNVGRQWLLNKPKMTLGRSRHSDIHVDAASLSKSHAQFQITAEGVTVTDLGATNRTSVNGVKLESMKAYPLKNNDQIRAGGLMFKFLQKGVVLETVEKARMQSELEVARNIQANLFPKENEAHYGKLKIGGRYRTATECGGDWWWHWKHGHRAFAIIADATGHGAGAALVTSAARSAVATMEDESGVDIGKVYSQISKALHKCAGGALTMSAFLIEVDLKTFKLRFINASHPAPIWLAKDSDNLSWNALPLLRGQLSPVLGSSDQKYDVGEFKAPKGARLILPTDGLAERQDAKGQAISERQFHMSLIAAHREAGRDQAAFLDALLQKSDELVLGAAQTDDITVVALDFP
jgi:serine phosphatase RsbU (regulator of sigma subunit)